MEVATRNPATSGNEAREHKLLYSEHQKSNRVRTHNINNEDLVGILIIIRVAVVTLFFILMCEYNPALADHSLNKEHHTKYNP